MSPEQALFLYNRNYNSYYIKRELVQDSLGES